MVTKEEKNMIELLESIFEILEGRINNQKTFDVGYYRGINWNGSNWVNIDGRLNIKINYSNRYTLLNEFGDIIDEFDIIDDSCYISIKENIIEDLKNFIKIIHEEYVENKEKQIQINKELKEILNEVEKNE